jgi:cytochrome c-type biogenesis protein
MDTLFTTLSHAVEGQPAIAVAAAFAWGVASLLLSPCHLSSIPLVVGFVNGHRVATPARGAAIAALFSLGLFTTIGVIGGVTAAAGRLMGQVGSWANYAVAGVFFVVGLSLLDVLPLGWTTPDSARFRGRGLLAAFALGLIFGVALGPCTFAYMAPMLGVTFAVSGTQIWYGILLTAAYGIGHCSIIVFAGASTSWVGRYLRWTDASRGAAYLRYASGLLVLAGGVYLIYTA